MSGLRMKIAIAAAIAAAVSIGASGLAGAADAAGPPPGFPSGPGSAPASPLNTYHPITTPWDSNFWGCHFETEYGNTSGDSYAQSEIYTITARTTACTISVQVVADYNGTLVNGPWTSTSTVGVLAYSIYRNSKVVGMHLSASAYYTGQHHSATWTITWT